MAASGSLPLAVRTDRSLLEQNRDVVKNKPKPIRISGPYNTHTYMGAGCQKNYFDVLRTLRIEFHIMQPILKCPGAKFR